MIGSHFDKSHQGAKGSADSSKTCINVEDIPVGVGGKTRAETSHITQWRATIVIEYDSMRMIPILSEILPVLGTVGLLGLWLYQQTGVEQRSSELQKLAAARSVFQAYQSNNALFNAINELSGKDNHKPDQHRTFQIYNYELGLAALEDALPASDKVGVPPRVSAYDGFPSVQVKMERLQKRLEILQARLRARETKVQESIAIAKQLYLWLYLGISLMAVMGAALKVVPKVSETLRARAATN